MNAMKRTLAAAAVAAQLVATAATIGPDWCVAYPDTGSKDVNRALQTVAEEVCADIREATGLALEALPASKAKAPAVFIGAAFAEKAGFDLSGYTWYDNTIAEKDGSIYLFGHDRPGRDPKRIKRISWFHCVLPSVRATTRFLEKYAGVRFLMPGEIGKEIPKCDAVAVPDGTALTEKPSIIYGNGRSGNIKNMPFYIANGIWGAGAFHTYGGHTYPLACPGNKYFKDHPEYFGLRNGRRMLGPNPGQTPLCISNPEVENLIVEELKRRFDDGADVCQLAQQDGSLKCQCDKCRELFGTGDDWNEKLWIFHRNIAERMLKERPGKIVHIINYGQTSKPPKTFRKFPANVMIELCRYTADMFAAWREYEVPHGFTVYTYLGGNYVMPGFVARHSFPHLAMLAKRFRENNVRGVYRCGTLGDLYGTEGPGYYLYSRLLHDGSLDIAETLNDYYRSAFGPAAGRMKKFYETQDLRLRMFDRISEPFPPGTGVGQGKASMGGAGALPKRPLDLHGWMFSPETVKTMESCLSLAEKTPGLSAKQKKRLELVRMEFDYAKLMGRISTLYGAYRLVPTKESFLPLADAVAKRNAYLDKLFGDKNTPHRIEGWPEINLFGGPTRKIMNTNGRLHAPIGAPLTWPVESMNGDILPGVAGKSADVTKTGAKPSFADFSAPGEWYNLSGISMENVPNKARFKAMYDNANIYILSECDLPDANKVISYPHDGSVWNDESLDFMIAPGDSRDIVYHFVYGPYPESRYDEATGLVEDPLDPEYGKPDRLWNGAGWKTESERSGGVWRSIATIPYADIGALPPQAGDTWLFNLGRTAKASPAPKDFTFMLWSPNMESRRLCDPEAMGKVVFK